MHMKLNGQSLYLGQNLMKGSRKVESNFANITFIFVNNGRFVYTDESHFYTKNPYSERWIFQGEEFHEEQRKSENQIIIVYGPISR